MLRKSGTLLYFLLKSLQDLMLQIKQNDITNDNFSFLLLKMVFKNISLLHDSVVTIRACMCKWAAIGISRDQSKICDMEIAVTVGLWIYMLKE